MSRYPASLWFVALSGLAACAAAPDYDSTRYPDDLAGVSCEEAETYYGELVRILPWLRQEYDALTGQQHHIQTYTYMPDFNVNYLWINESLEATLDRMNDVENKLLILEDRLRSCGTLERVRGSRGP